MAIKKVYKMYTIHRLCGRFCLALVVTFSCSGQSWSDWTIKTQNFTGIANQGYTICVQGFAVNKPEIDFLDAVGLNFKKNQSAPVTNTNPSQPITPLPSFQVTGSTAFTINNTSGLNLNGSRVYYYLQGPKNGAPQACGNLLYYSYQQTINNKGKPNQTYTYTINGVQTPSLINSPVSYTPFTYVEFSPTGTNLDIDLSQVDAFTLPVNVQVAPAFSVAAASPIPAYSFSNIGQPVNAYFNSQAIVAEYQNSVSGAYLSLVTNWGGSAPTGLQYLTSPADYLGRLVVGSGSIVNPSVTSSLNNIFDNDLNALFKKTIFINKTGSATDNWRGEPTLASYAGAYKKLTALGFCEDTGVPCSQSGGYKYYVYNPVGLTVLANNGKYILGTQTAGSPTVSFSPGLSHGLVSVGMYITAPAGILSVGAAKVIGVTNNADGTIKSVTLNTNADMTISGNVAQYQFSILPQKNSQNKVINGQFSSSGAMVFGNSGAFGKTFNNADPSGNLGVVLAAALNRGVTGITCSNGNGLCGKGSDSTTWGTAGYWYPPASLTTSGGNLYSKFLHTAKLPYTSNGKRYVSNLFCLPNGSLSAKDASGEYMGMAYGFALDETNIGDVNNYAVPSEFSSVKASTAISVTLLPLIAYGNMIYK